MSDCISNLGENMLQPVNPGNHPIKGLNECNEISPLQEDLYEDKEYPQCEPKETNIPSCAPVFNPTVDQGWLHEAANKKIGIGDEANCDPIQSGQIVNDIKKPNRNIVYRYSKGIRGADEAMLNLFKGLVVLDEDGQAHPVPIIWGTQERAVQYVLAENMRKDNSTVVDRPKLPLMSIYSSSMELDRSRYVYHQALNYMRYLRPDRKPGFTVKERYDRDTIYATSRGIPINIGYTLLAWTYYIEDMDQILEQVLTKFSPVAYIQVRGVNWEVMVTLDSIANNIDIETGDQKQRVVKYEFNITAQTYIPQPIVRKKAVLDIKTDIYNGLSEEEMTEVLGRLEVAVKELDDRNKK